MLKMILQRPSLTKFLYPNIVHIKHSKSLEDIVPGIITKQQTKEEALFSKMTILVSGFRDLFSQNQGEFSEIERGSSPSWTVTSPTL